MDAVDAALQAATKEDKSSFLFELVPRGAGYTCTGMIFSLCSWINPSSDDDRRQTRLNFHCAFTTIRNRLAAIKGGLKTVYMCDITAPGKLYQCLYLARNGDSIDKLAAMIQKNPVRLCGWWVPRCQFASQLQRSDYYTDYEWFWEKP